MNDNIISQASSVCSHVVLLKKNVKQDCKLNITPREKNNGRKVFVNEIFHRTETNIKEPIWRAEELPTLTPVVETGYGGIEIATFNERAGQDRHKHLCSTEIYTVLEGTMRIRINDADPIEVKAGDEIIVFPGTIHEVLIGRKFLVRVHAINCFGDRDKYIQKEGIWCQVLTIKNLEKTQQHR